VSTISYEQAVEQAITLRKQGVTYPKIQEHLKKAGYISPHSNQPVGHQALRAMVNKAEKEAGSKVKGAKVGPVTSPKADILEAIKAISEAESISVDQRLKLVTHILKTSERF
jgi:hypothetical protein